MAIYSITKCLRTDKPQKKNGLYPIYFRIRVQGKETKVPTGFEVAQTGWNDKKKEPKENSLRMLLAKKESEIEEHFRQYLLDGKDLTIDFVKGICSGRLIEKPENKSFYEYFEHFIDSLKKKKENGERIANGTIDSYKYTLAVLKKFKAEVKLKDITPAFIQAFDDYLAYERKNSPGGRRNRHSPLRAVINNMRKLDMPVKDVYKNFEMPQAGVGDVFLDWDELQLMRGLRPKLVHSKTKYKVLQMYLFSCYCGLRFSDIQDLKWSDIDLGNKLINKEQIKTHLGVNAPIFSWARAILLELSDSKKLFGTKHKVFRSISSTYANKILSELAEMVGLDKHLTFHSARRTFATLLVVKYNADIYKVSRFLGHSSIDMTKRYIQHNPTIAATLVQEMDAFSYGTSK